MKTNDRHADGGDEFVTVRLYADDGKVLSQLVACGGHKHIADAYRSVCAKHADQARRKAMRKQLSAPEVGGEG